MRVVAHFAEHEGEPDLDLVTDEVGRLYPRLIRLNDVMSNAALQEVRTWAQPGTANEVRREQLRNARYEQEIGRTIQLLDPQRIVRNQYYGRHCTALAHANFVELKAGLEYTAGNQVPVLVRPSGDHFELAYGGLRHQALAELSLPVLAIVQEVMTERELVTAMLAEARGGTPLSALELGTSIRSMLNAGFLRSKQEAAELMGCRLKDVSGSLAIAELPTPVLSAFDTPTDIRAPWVPKLLEVYERDPAGFPQCVANAKASRLRADARALFLALTAATR